MDLLLTFIALVCAVLFAVFLFRAADTYSKNPKRAYVFLLVSGFSVIAIGLCAVSFVIFGEYKEFSPLQSPQTAKFLFNVTFIILIGLGSSLVIRTISKLRNLRKGG
jgi:uncharacterized membrane protein